MYLNVRLPLPVNSNPGMVFPRLQFRGSEDMFCWVSRVVDSICKYKHKLDNRYIPQDKAASKEPGQPLCMAQYFRLLTSYRQPGQTQDSIISSGDTAKQNEHVVVLRRGSLYKMAVKLAGRWVRVEEIYSSLLDIWEDTETKDVCPLTERVGIITATNRTDWSVAYNALCQDPTNLSNLETIASALFIVCLDEETQNKSDVYRSLKDQFRQMLTGAGTKFNGSNRWFDKTLQVVVSLDGVAGVCYEHSVSEGIVPVQVLTNILQDLGDRWESSLAYHPSTNLFSRLNWNLDSSTKHITSAIKVLDDLDLNNDLEVFRFHVYGKEFIKTCRCSPDAWVQLSLQLTMYRLRGGLVATYESASTRRFRDGRVDSIRAGHSEALAWCQTMDQHHSKDEKRKLFELAIKKQTTVMVGNILGNGLDIPLLGLREATKAVGRWEEQTLFNHPAYANLNNFILSTSQVPVPMDPSFMGYGAVVPDGYGVSYNPYPASILFCICSYHDCETTNSRSFANSFQRSLQDMKQLFVK